MIEYKNIRRVHLELSSFCNARCPLCPRNLYGYPFNNGGYTESNLTLTDVKKIFDVEFIKQLELININGNFGDFVMNPESLEIVQYFNSINPSLSILISTNGSARDETFWEELGKISNVFVDFCLDGLKDTHHLYRQNTSWKTIIKNAKVYTEAGGYAIWKFIKFKHNQHQIAECEELSKQLGFREFKLADQGRDTGPVFDKEGNYLHALGDYNGETDINKILNQVENGMMLLEDLYQHNSPKNTIRCQAIENQEIFVSSTGDVSPCCWLGIEPKTYGKGRYHEPCNKQLKNIISKNNALQYPLKECIDWFAEVEKSWKIKSYYDGRLILCDEYCGSNN